MSQIRKIKNMRTSSMSSSSPIPNTKSAAAKSQMAAAAAAASASAAAAAAGGAGGAGGGAGGAAAGQQLPPKPAIGGQPAVGSGKIIGNVTPQKKVTMIDKDEELVASSPSERNWRGIFIALLVIAGVLGLIVFSIFLLSPEDEGQRVKGRRLVLGDVIGNALKWKRFNGSWIGDGELIYRDPAGGLTIMTAATGATRVLMTDSAFRQLNANTFDVSPDLKYVLLASTNPEPNPATSAATSDEPPGRTYSVYEVANRNIFPLTPHSDITLKPPPLQLVRWAPSLRPTSASQGVAFVHQNDVYYKPKVQHDLVCRLTTTGSPGTIYNGLPDWLYANTAELRGGPTLAFSPDGGHLAFLAFNDTLVDRYEYTWLGDSWKYPQIRSIRYPKEGSRQPNVTVYVVDLSALKLIQRIRIQPPQLPTSPPSSALDTYVGRMQWASAGHLAITFMDRAQTVAVTALCAAPQFACRPIHTEQIVDGAPVLANDPLVFSRLLNASVAEETAATVGNSSAAATAYNVNEFEAVGGAAAAAAAAANGAQRAGFMLKRLPVRDGEHGHYRHVVFVAASGADRRTVPLTMGQFEVTELLGWDEPEEMVYFMAAPHQRAGERHLYRVRVRLNVTRAPSRIVVSASRPACLTCDNGRATFRLPAAVAERRRNGTTGGGGNEAEEEEEEEAAIPNNCLYNVVHMSADFGHYVQECLGPEVPSVYLVETRSRQKVRVLHGGDLLRERLRTVAVPQIQTFQVEIRHGFHAQVRLMLPPGMRVDEDVAFPMILQVDGAPGSQLVSQRFEVDWNWYLSSQRSMIVAQIDGRGSGGQGELLRSQLRGHLGTVEIEDQLGVLTYLRDKFRFIDPTRICAYGWGYGGYAASMVLAEDSQRVLQCAAAVNPIVSFAHHSTFFTDRYMPVSPERIRALQESDLSMRAGNIDSRNYFLVHGTADTLVHQQHSLMLARSLIDQGVGFRHQVYTDEGHQLAGVLQHLYKTLEWFFDESFGPADNADWDPTGFFAFKQ